MNKDNGFDRAEKEFLEPPDVEESECECCGAIEELDEYRGFWRCPECKRDAQYRFELKEDEEE